MKDSQRKAMFAGKKKSDITLSDIEKIVPTKTGTKIITSYNGHNYTKGVIKHHDASQLKYARRMNDVLIGFSNGTSQFLPRDNVVLDLGLPKTHPALQAFAKERRSDIGEKNVKEHVEFQKKYRPKARQLF